MSLLTDARRERASKQIIPESRARCGNNPRFINAADYLMLYQAFKSPYL